MKQNNRVATYLALTGAMVFWGLSFVATKMALESFPAFTLIFTRFALASCFFVILILRRGIPAFDRRSHVKFLLIALFEPGLYFIFETVGLQYTSAPKAALIISTIPIVVLVSASLLLGERPNPVKIIGICASFIGIGVLIGGDPHFHWTWGGSILGDLMIFGAVLSAACYMVCARDLGKKYSALEITSMQVIYGALLYAPAFFWEMPGFKWSAVSGSALAALIYLTLFATIIAFLCYNYALTVIPVSRAAVFINGIPVVTMIGAWVMLGETLTWMQAAGGAIVLSAVYVSNRPEFRLRLKKIS
jgi:drug/metabolite transporter (DMT)-like permease